MSATGRGATLALALLLMAAPAFVQAQSAVTEADIERARRDTPTVTEEDIARARAKYRSPPELSGAAPAPAGPRLDALPQPEHAAPVDLEAIARGYERTTAADGPSGFASGPQLLVFVSLSMPEATLRRLVDQAARAGAPVMLRGFAHGSLRETVARVQALIGSRQAAVQIDPRAFDRYAVTRVPSFVLVHAGASASCADAQCAPAEDFLQASGDVSLDYVLERMQALPPFAPDAAAFLARLKG